MDIPYRYRPANPTAKKPPQEETLDGVITNFYARYLMKRAISAIKLTIPNTWPKNYVQYTLFGLGFGAVIDVPRYGVTFQAGTFYGRNVYYQPTRFITTNPLFTPPPDGWKIGQNCALIKLQPDFTGVEDIVLYYASRLALAADAWHMNTQNSKYAYILGAKDNSQAKTFYALTDAIRQGKPAVAVGTNLFSKDGKPLWTSFNQNLAQSYISPEISEDMRNIMAEFDSFVGIPSNPNAGKRERQIVDEVNANNVETDTLLDIFVETLTEGFSQANDMFGLHLKAEKKYSTQADMGAQKEGEQNGDV